MRLSRIVILSVLLPMALAVGCAPTAARPTAAADPTPASPEAAGSWEVAFQTDVRHPTIAAEFLDEAFGVVVGDAGELYYTADGGGAWVVATQDAARSRAGLDIVHENVAWLVGVGGRVWVSADGARSWREVSRLPYGGHVEFASFVDAQAGWAASAESSELWKTADGGQTWVEVALPDKLERLAAIVLRTARDGYLLDSVGTLYVTGDGGQSWSSRTLGLEESWAIPVLTPSAAVRFLDAKRGLIVLSLTRDGESEVWSLHTSDGGQTWRRERVPVVIGQYYLTHDGALLTVADLVDSGKITVLRTAVLSVASP